MQIEGAVKVALALIALLGCAGFATLVLGLLRLPTEKKSAEVSDADKLTDSALKIVTRLESEVTRLRERVDVLEKRDVEKDKLIHRLQSELVAAKIRIKELEAKNRALQEGC